MCYKMLKLKAPIGPVAILRICYLWKLLIFNSKKVHEDDVFDRQDILQFFSELSKDLKYVKFALIGLAL